MKKCIVSLCDRSGIMVKPWAKAGWECYCVDTAHSIRADRLEGNTTYCWGDVRSWTPPGGRQVAMLFGFPPCTDLASSGARDFKKKSWPLLRDGMDLFWACLQAGKWAGCPYMVENPVGRIAGIHEPATYTFDPCDYGDPYTKKTCLWTGGGFVMPPKNRVEPVEGSKILDYGPSEDRQAKRSETPAGFARAVYESNKNVVSNE